MAVRAIVEANGTRSGWKSPCRATVFKKSLAGSLPDLGQLACEHLFKPQVGLNSTTWLNARSQAYEATPGGNPSRNRAGAPELAVPTASQCIKRFAAPGRAPPAAPELGALPGSICAHRRHPAGATPLTEATASTPPAFPSELLVVSSPAPDSVNVPSSEQLIRYSEGQRQRVYSRRPVLTVAWQPSSAARPLWVRSAQGLRPQRMDLLLNRFSNGASHRRSAISECCFMSATTWHRHQPCLKTGSGDAAYATLTDV